MDYYTFIGSLFIHKKTRELFRCVKDSLFTADEEATSFDWWDKEKATKDNMWVLLERLDAKRGDVANYEILVPWNDLMNKYQRSDKKLIHLFGKKIWMK